MGSGEYKQIFALGDLHGSWDQCIKALKLAKLINSSNDWIAKNTCLVQIGDQIDSKLKSVELTSSSDLNKDDDVKIMKLFFKLKRQAPRFKSEVVLLTGNHELMNTQGAFDYVSTRGMTKAALRREVFKPGGKIAMMMAKNTKVIAMLNGIIFCHAGILPKHIERLQFLGKSAEYINDMFKAYLEGKSYNKQDFEFFLNNRDSVLWNRVYSFEEPQTRMKGVSILNTVLNVTNCKAMVIGHNPQLRGITSYERNKLWIVDAGISYAVFFNKPQLLKITFSLSGVPEYAVLT